MHRTDSAFAECAVLATQSKPGTIRRSRTIPTRHQSSKPSSANLDANDQISTMPTIRPTSEKHNSSSRPRTNEARRKSMTSSSKNSAQSRRPGYSSSPSSRRTSCTVVEPSRPARHYRINTSQTCPTNSRDIDDVLALHFRACSLFQGPTVPTSHLASAAASGSGVDALEGIGLAQGPSPSPQPRSLPGPPTGSEAGEKASATTPQAVQDTTMHWMSPSTRKCQYEKIDRAYGGLRGLLRKMLPGCVHASAPQRFYDDDKEDAGSVRRYRMHLPDEDHADAVSTSGLRMQRRKLERSRPQRCDGRSKRFGCF